MPDRKPDPLILVKLYLKFPHYLYLVGAYVLLVHLLFYPNHDHLIISFCLFIERTRSGSKPVTLISALQNKYSTSSMKSTHCQIFITSKAPGKTGIISL